MIHTLFHDFHFQDKQELLAKWVQNGENLAAVECALQLQRKQEGELEHGRELLTVSEMKAKGFSTSIGTHSEMIRIFSFPNVCRTLLLKQCFCFWGI